MIPDLGRPFAMSQTSRRRDSPSASMPSLNRPDIFRTRWLHMLRIVHMCKMRNVQHASCAMCNMCSYRVQLSLRRNMRASFTTSIAAVIGAGGQ